MIHQLIDIVESQNLWAGELTLKRNDFLNTEGRTDRKVYLIKSGCLRAFMMDGAEEHTIRFGYEQEIFTALDSFFTGAPSSFFIQALKKTELSYITRDTLMQLLFSNPDLLQFWVQILEALNVQQIEREMDLLTTSPQERYQRVLKRSPELFQKIPLKYIANYLRMTPETLSRIKKS